LALSKITVPGRNDSIVDRLLKPLQRFNAWMQIVSEGAQTLTGTATPEGAVDGKIGQRFVDTSASKVYLKGTDGGNTGWLILN